MRSRRVRASRDPRSAVSVVFPTPPFGETIAIVAQRLSFGSPIVRSRRPRYSGAASVRRRAAERGRVEHRVDPVPAGGPGRAAAERVAGRRAVALPGAVGGVAPFVAWHPGGAARDLAAHPEGTHYETNETNAAQSFRAG